VAQDATILLVDDEPLVRTVARRILEAEDYEVVEAADGVEALERCDEQAFDVVVTDVVMPRMDGLELIAGLAGRPGALRAVVTSAYTQRLPDDAPENVRWWFVPKPYTSQTLLAAVIAALAAA
jgi:CheY-like chemotaxis protein